MAVMQPCRFVGVHAGATSVAQVTRKLAGKGSDVRIVVVRTFTLFEFPPQPTLYIPRSAPERTVARAPEWRNRSSLLSYTHSLSPAKRSTSVLSHYITKIDMLREQSDSDQANHHRPAHALCSATYVRIPLVPHL
jgi:hypothetical protein